MGPHFRLLLPPAGLAVSRTAILAFALVYTAGDGFARSTSCRTPASIATAPRRSNRVPERPTVSCSATIDVRILVKSVPPRYRDRDKNAANCLFRITTPCARSMDRLDRTRAGDGLKPHTPSTFDDSGRAVVAAKSCASVGEGTHACRSEASAVYDILSRTYRSPRRLLQRNELSETREPGRRAYLLVL